MGYTQTAYSAMGNGIEADCKKMVGSVGDLPSLFYKIYLSKNVFGKKSYFRRLDKEELQMVLGFVNDRDIRQEIFEQLKQNTFSGGYFNSRIMSEILGTVRFITSSVNYCIVNIKQKIDYIKYR